MNYKLARALGYGVLLYIATFIVAFICGAVLGDNKTSLNEMPAAYWYLGMVAAVVLTFVFTRLYFRSPALTSSAKNGLLFGLTAVITSSLLDLAFFSLGNMSSDPAAHVDMGQYYGDYRFWIIIVLVLATATLTGAKKSPRLSTQTPL